MHMHRGNEVKIKFQHQSKVPSEKWRAEKLLKQTATKYSFIIETIPYITLIGYVLVELRKATSDL